MDIKIEKDKTVKHRKSKKKEKNLVALSQFLKKIKQNGRRLRKHKTKRR